MIFTPLLVQLKAPGDFSRTMNILDLLLYLPLSPSAPLIARQGSNPMSKAPK